MDTTNNQTLYLRLRKRIQVPSGHVIRLGDVAQMIADPKREAQLKQLELYKPRASEGNLILIDMLQIVKRIRETAPELVIENYGDPHVLVELQTKARPFMPKVLLFMIIWLLLFIGSGLAIMNFHADVSMKQVHIKVYKFITGQEETYPYFLQVPYSVGLGAGMILFFNRLFKKKFNEEPNPLEVEMFMYEESVRQYVIADEYRKQQQSDEGSR